MTDTQVIDNARDYINSAPTPEERTRRKQEMYVFLYSSGPKSFRNLFEAIKEERLFDHG